TDAAVAGNCGVHHEDARYLHEVWAAGQLLSAHLRIGRACCGWCFGQVRSAVSGLFCATCRRPDSPYKLAAKRHKTHKSELGIFVTFVLLWLKDLAIPPHLI